MKLVRTAIHDVVIVEPTVFSDDRGWFTESFNARRFGDALSALGLDAPGPFVQDNHSSSKRGVVRGLHYQLPPRAQGKLVRVVRGRAFDVVVDLRRSSPTFRAWVSVELAADNRLQLWIPPGFAHGFLALEDDTELEYKTTDYYAPESERSLRWSDPVIGIQWPVLEGRSVLAEKDRTAPELGSADLF